MSTRIWKKKIELVEVHCSGRHPLLWFTGTKDIKVRNFLYFFPPPPLSHSTSISILLFRSAANSLAQCRLYSVTSFTTLYIYITSVCIQCCQLTVIQTKTKKDNYFCYLFTKLRLYIVLSSTFLKKIQK